MSYNRLGERRVLCVGNGWHFCTPVLYMNMCYIKFEVPRLSRPTFVLKKSSEKKLFTIIFVVKRLKGFGWNNVGPASQPVAPHYFTIRPMYRVIRVVAFRGMRRHPYGSRSTQFCCNVGPASSTIDRHRTSDGLRRWPNIEPVGLLCG